MTLEEQARQVLNDFENTPSEKILLVLGEIQTHFKSNLTRDYLNGKIQTIKESKTEEERKTLCKNLVPYLDWYLQGV
ncbi:MAG: hypothetical protein K5793_02815 [Nitrosarchaeum sp.]|nr:hypothetical protein [Nitrosarchaeum sp.]